MLTSRFFKINPNIFVLFSEHKAKRMAVTSSIWEMPMSERKNAATFLEFTTIKPFVYYCYNFKCLYCNEQYPEIHALLQHNDSHEIPDRATILEQVITKGRTVRADISKLKCKICQKKHTNLDTIREHLIKEHNKEFTESGNGFIEYNLTTENGQFQCHLCSKICQTFVLLNCHMNVHFRNCICEICGAAFMTHKRLMKHKSIHLPGYPCDLCEKVYTSNANLRNHVEKAHVGIQPEKSLKCPYCTEKFEDHYRKLRHLKNEHGITFTFECEVCKKVFSTRRALTAHTNQFHTQKTQCEICKKSLSSRSALKKHLLSHTDERNICPFCDKAYIHELSLKRHVRIHHGNNSDVITCFECGGDFLNRRDFKKHVNDAHSYSNSESSS